MREYKFRGKCVERNKWAYGCYVKGVQEDKAYILKKHDGYWPWGDIWFVVYPETVGQFTGLHDKNGREIYEGDVVKAKDPYIIDGKERFYICEVVFAECAMFMLKHTYNNYGKVKTRYFGLRDMETEVIGNIYDNPELLKEGSV